MPNTRILSTKDVARYCLVTDATVKRWADAGLLRSERTNGGHRRFHLEEVIRFRREHVFKVKQGQAGKFVTNGLGEDPKGKSVQMQFLRSLLDGSEQDATEILLCEILNGWPLEELIDNTICPAMREIGLRWSNGDLSITREHLASSIVVSAVHRLRNVLTLPKIGNGLAICCGIEGNFHQIPTLLAQITLENEGFNVINFGADTPLFLLSDEVLRYSPKIVCISATVVVDIDRIIHDFEGFREKTTKLNIPVMIAGQALNDENVRKRFAYEFYAQSFAELAEYARNSL